MQKLRELDNQPELVNAHFDSLAYMPMGKYFEQLMFFILEHDDRYEIILQNHQIREEKTTIGEIDLIVKDTLTGRQEHWEMALKFYLQSDDSSEQSKMIGPNAADNLGRKMDKLTKHQLLLSNHPSIKSLLGVEELQPKLFLKGQFFYHLQKASVFPLNANPNHEKGWWCHLSEIETMISENLHWLALEKPDWIRIYQPDGKAQFLSSSEIRMFLFNHINQKVKPIFLAGMTKTAAGWIEHTRGFVVGDNWPNSIS